MFISREKGKTEREIWNKIKTTWSKIKQGEQV